MLDGVHRYTGPGAGVDIAMMQLVRNFVQRWPVRQAMNAIKMHRSDKEHAVGTNDQVKRVVDKAWRGNKTVGVNPEGIAS